MTTDFEQLVFDAKYLLKRQRPSVTCWRRASICRSLVFALPVLSTFERSSSAELSIFELYRAGGRTASSGYIEVRYATELEGREWPESVNRNHLAWTRGHMEVEGTFTGDVTVAVQDLDRRTAEVLGGLFEVPLRRALQHVNGLIPLPAAA